MKRISCLLALACATLGSPAVADELAPALTYTDVAPYTDVGSAREAPRHWKGDLSRTEVIAALREARAGGTVAMGEAIGYPYLMKYAAGTPSAAMLGGPASEGPAPAGVTIDGYRFVGGEAGYIRR